jgi:Sporulation and spore germination
LIPRYQTILLILLVLASIGMGAMLWHMRERAHQEMIQGHDAAPTKAPAVAANAQATLVVANDDDNGLREQVYSLPLPAEDGARIRAILGKLLEIYATPDANHPVPSATGPNQVLPVQQVFLLPASGSAMANPVAVMQNPEGSYAASTQLAVVNLAGSFVASHPSGLETETLTVLSICRTIHANLPHVTEVRFLVDGQPRPTLAGHADLTRTYLIADAIQSTNNAQNQ